MTSRIMKGSVTKVDLQLKHVLALNAGDRGFKIQQSSQNTQHHHIVVLLQDRL